MPERQGGNTADEIKTHMKIESGVPIRFISHKENLSTSYVCILSQLKNSSDKNSVVRAKQK